MPLPPAPTKRAALLSPDAFRATPKSRREDSDTDEAQGIAPAAAALTNDNAAAPRKAAAKTARATAAGSSHKVLTPSSAM